MQTATTPLSNRTFAEILPAGKAAGKVRRLAWQALSDLGMTEDEIAAYYATPKSDPGALRLTEEAASRASASEH